MGLGIVGTMGQGPAVALGGVGEAELLGQGDAQIVVGVGVVGPKADRLAVAGDRLVDLVLLGQGDAEVLVGTGIVGPEADCLAIGGGRLGMGAEVIERPGEVEPRSG